MASPTLPKVAVRSGRTPEWVARHLFSDGDAQELLTKRTAHPTGLGAWLAARRATDSLHHFTHFAAITEATFCTLSEFYMHFHPYQIAK
jgi:hypothetical protein